ncbi:MAG: NAD-glutamate dehydrogenase [Betaproteobacteria bacterium]|nr:NAD-glutamate dehydrogenase [Betaproteobacteria bacterium]
MEASKTALLATVSDCIHERLSPEDAAKALAFTRQYYAQVSAEDLVERSVQDLYGAALSHWRFSRRAVSGTPLLRVYNPRAEEHGWNSTHTVMEIVSDDMPFLVDSITMEVNRQGLTQHLIIHPIMKMRADSGGCLECLAQDDENPASIQVSLIHVEVDRRTAPEHLEALQAGVTRVLGDVRAAVMDWPVMRQRLKDVLLEIERDPPPGNPADAAESAAFLQWLADDNFTLLGYREYRLANQNGQDMLHALPGSGAGILRETRAHSGSSFAVLPPEVKALARQPHLLLLTKTNARSTVHRPAYLDYLGIRRFDDHGAVVGEHRFLGLFTSTAYNANPSEIPLLRRKLAMVIQRAGFLPKSHARKALQTILEQYPRDELLQIDVDQLYPIVMGILGLGERQRTRLFMRRDAFRRFYSCLIYTPRENFDSSLRMRMQNILLQALNGDSTEFNVLLTESALARIHILVHTRPDSQPNCDEFELEKRLVKVARRWEDDLFDALRERYGEERGNLLYLRYKAGFPVSYKDAYAAHAAVGDIELMESLNDPDSLALNLYLPLEAHSGNLRFKILRLDEAVPLSLSLPMLEHMGVRVLEERPYAIPLTCAETKAPGESSQTVWLHDVGLSLADAEKLDIHHVRHLFQETFLNVWRGAAENDDFNRLVLAARLSWHEVAVLRAYAKYLKQTGFTFSQSYIEQTLTAHPVLAQQLLALFQASFDPAQDAGRAERCGDIALAITDALDQVANLDEDRILRQFLATIQATLRTNYFQLSDGAAKPYLSFKLDSQRVPGLPEPRPLFEIFVYSPRFEGIHLRGGKVARGGLRWSDRMEDFRTEVLGLMKAQMVKNVVIVPVGSKGGFYIKNAPPAAEREAVLNEGVACYRTYLRGLLDLTDNLVAGQVVPPRDVVRKDGDDPYLVVAADKGTASFSDYANGVSREYGFWLGDAFASGGSAGYDHKKMAITARGAWESVQRHFRELGVNTQQEDFTVIGIGDMSGDVFGNGMLLSGHIKLVAAFDHRHIFIDPAPDPEISLAERRRLFDQPRSSWADYDARLISPGGGIYPRSAKAIRLSPEARAVLGIEADTLAPLELIHAILVAPVDLLYNGGIGTYVKGSQQSHADAGDRTNDAIRVNGEDLRCRVVAEGGNLGFTQLGRIEYALRGGRINTDAIDNSAGVDCSDHEVNIKILLNAVMGDGELTEKQRNQLLAEMTDEVAQLVLRDNYFQNQILGVTRTQGVRLLDEQTRYIRYLSNNGKLNRRIEFLPFDEEIAERRTNGIGLVAPELAVLLAYSKMELFELLMASSVPEDPYICTALERYFPKPLRERYSAQIQRHPLRREIIATHVANSMINRVGPTFVFRLQQETAAAPADIVRAYIAAREVFGQVSLWQAIEKLDNQVASITQTRMVLESLQLIERATLWFLKHRQYLGDLAATLNRFTANVGRLEPILRNVVATDHLRKLDEASDALGRLGVPAALAHRVAAAAELHCALDIVEVASDLQRPVTLVAKVYFGLGGLLDLHWIAQQVAVLQADTHWQGLARSALGDDLSSLACALTTQAFRENPELDDPLSLVSAWQARRSFQFERCRQLLAELKTLPTQDIAMLSVALRELRGLA